MKYEDFEKFVREKCMYDTIYDDSDGRPILIIRMLDAYGMVNKAQHEWVGLTAYEIQELHSENLHWGNFACAINAKLKEKNGY